MNKNNSFPMKLDVIQPSQLYISSLKLERLQEWFKPEEFDNYDPIPIKELNGRIIFLDGHTRAFAAYLRGVKM